MGRAQGWQGRKPGTCWGSQHLADPHGGRGPVGGMVGKDSGHGLPSPSSRAGAASGVQRSPQPEIRLWHPGGTWYQALLIAPLSQCISTPLEHHSRRILITSLKGRDGGRPPSQEAVWAGPGAHCRALRHLALSFSLWDGNPRSLRSLTV